MFHKNRLKRPILTIIILSVLLVTLHQFSVLQNLFKFFQVLVKVLSEFKPTISRNISDVRLLLWTNKDLEHFSEIHKIDIDNSDFDQNRLTKVLIHGFADHGLTSFVKTLKNKYLQKYDVNIISVDWEPLAKSPWYTTARKNSE